MADRQQKNGKPPVDKPQGWISKTLSWTLGVLGALVMTIALSVIIELVGIAAGWWPQSHAAGLLFIERSYIESIDRFPLTALTPIVVAEQADQHAHALIGGVYTNALNTQASDPLSPYLLGALNITLLVVLRLVVALFTLPGFALVAIAAVIDGGVRRDIRKYTGEHESSYVFHGTKRFVIPGIAATVSLYLLLPFAVYPALVFAPAMALFGYMLFVITGRFKKYV